MTVVPLTVSTASLPDNQTPTARMSPRVVGRATSPISTTGVPEVAMTAVRVKVWAFALGARLRCTGDPPPETSAPGPVGSTPAIHTSRASSPYAGLAFVRSTDSVEVASGRQPWVNGCP